MRDTKKTGVDRRFFFVREKSGKLRAFFNVPVRLVTCSSKRFVSASAN